MINHVDQTITDFKPASSLTVNAGSGSAVVELADALECYPRWSPPVVIIVDGPYGLGKFPGDPHSPEELPRWYEPHVREWSRFATPQTTLWFWCSEVGWAEVHPILKQNGWIYRAAHVWDKGIGHVAGNCNGDTIRGFPVVTELCVRYVRDVKLIDESGTWLPIKEWLRREWLRSGLPLSETNIACSVRNAATRKYFTRCHLWYFPPPDKMAALAGYANSHGKPEGRPYFALQGKKSVTEDQWSSMRAKWNHTHGLTNVWREPAVRGLERLKGEGLKCLHMNQKPLKLLERLILASSDPGDIIWEPFGGLCSTGVASLITGRHCFSAEVNAGYFDVAASRLRKHRQDDAHSQPRVAAAVT